MSHLSTLPNELTVMIQNIDQLKIFLNHLSENQQKRLLITLNNQLEKIISNYTDFLTISKILSTQNSEWLLKNLLIRPDSTFSFFKKPSSPQQKQLPEQDKNKTTKLYN